MSRKKKKDKSHSVSIFSDTPSYFPKKSSSYSVFSGTGSSHKDEPSPMEIIKEILCGRPKENPKPLTFWGGVRRSFIVLDNLIAAVLLFYFLTWIKFYSNGEDTSFDVIIGDMTMLCWNNVVAFIIFLGITWRRLYYSDSFPCLKNLTYKWPYNFFYTSIIAASAIYFIYWLRMFVASGFDIDAMFIPYGDEERYQNPVDFLPYWAQEIRIVVFCGVTTIRKCFLEDVDKHYGKKLGWFERKSSQAQKSDTQENHEPANGGEPKEEEYACGDQTNL